MLETLRKTRVFLDRRQRRRWLALVPLAVATAGLEALGAGAVFLLIRLVSDPGRAAQALPERWGGDLLARIGPTRSVALLSLGLGLFYVAKNLLRLLEAYARERCAATTVVSVSTRLLRGYLSAPYALHLRRNSAELIRNTTQAANLVGRTLLGSATSVLSESLVVVGMVGVLVVSAPVVALSAGVMMAVPMVALLRLTQRRHSVWGAEAHERQAGLLRSLQQSLGGVKEVKLLGREAFFEKSFERHRAGLARIEVQRNTLSLAPRLVVETLFVCGVAAVIFAAQVRGGTQLVPLLGLFAYAGLRVLPSLHWIVYHLNEIGFGAAALDGLHADWVDLALRAPAPRTAQLRSERLALRDRISLEHVSYSYAGAARPALEDVQLSIARGESVGFVGPTGAGKTTLIDLVLGLLVPTRGRICVDGVEIHDRLESWQRQIGYVPQSVHLTDDTIQRNVALGLEDDEIDEARLSTALQMAQLETFVSSLPAGLDTRVGERGVRLSGGQRQRIAVARALYHDPEVLVFDEATSALDAQTEQALTHAIESLQRRKTLLIIAHRLTTVRHCDRLVFLREGRVADVGSFEVLAERSAEFRAMAALAHASG